MREAKVVFMYVCGSFRDAVNSDSDLDEDYIVGVVRLQETFLENYICVFSGCLWQLSCLTTCRRVFVVFSACQNAQKFWVSVQVK